MKKSPLQLVQEKFTDKQSLINAVRSLATPELWVERISGAKGLEHVSNQKLLHLHEVLSRVKSEFGSRDKLIEAVQKIEKRIKDAGYKTHLERLPVPRLWDHYRSARKRHAAAAK